ncbi:MAG: NAD(P)H-hydrate epimerase [Microbacteriaceae bacterium]
MRGYSAEQVRAAERPLLEAGAPLMERAAAALAHEIRLRYAPRRLLLLVGAGDNGGDALFAGAALAAAGADVGIARLGSRLHGTGLAAALAAGAHEVADPVPWAAGADVVVDGILGTGATPPLRPAAAGTVAQIAALANRPPVVAVDLPSGVDPTTGAIPAPPVLSAAVTVTFGGAKAGLLLEPGASCAGEIVVVDIGIGEELERMTPVVER